MKKSTVEAVREAVLLSLDSATEHGKLHLTHALALLDEKPEPKTKPPVTEHSRDWFRLGVQADRNAAERYWGNEPWRWRAVPGALHRVRVPVEYTHHRTCAGRYFKMPREQVVAAPCYFPNGAYPEGVVDLGPVRSA